MICRLPIILALVLCVVLAFVPPNSTQAQEGADKLFETALRHQEQEEFDTARRLYSESLELFKASDDKNKVSIVYQNLGDIARQRDELKEATRLFSLSAELDESIGEKERAGETYRKLGFVALRRGDLQVGSRAYYYSKGEQFYLKALKLLKDKATITRVHHLLASLASERNDLATACKHLWAIVILHSTEDNPKPDKTMQGNLKLYECE